MHLIKPVYTINIFLTQVEYKTLVAISIDYLNILNWIIVALSQYVCLICFSELL